MPKPNPKPSGPVALDDEDAVFLSAMGMKSTLPRPAPPLGNELPACIPVTAEPSAPVSFQDAVKDLKGLKPLQKGLPDLASPPPPAANPPGPARVPPLPKATATTAPSESAAAVLELAAEPAAQPPAPLRFQLAAGMAIEVDGALDLRGHSLTDAMERLKDRLGDGLVLGWRSLQVTLGTDSTLHDGLIALLTSGQAPMIARYAQAPVPMGGTQAWLLYFGPSLAQP
jgi:hypothetical protein